MRFNSLIKSSRAQTLTEPFTEFDGLIKEKKKIEKELNSASKKLGLSREDLLLNALFILSSLKNLFREIVKLFLPQIAQFIVKSAGQKEDKE